MVYRHGYHLFYSIYAFCLEVFLIFGYYYGLYSVVIDLPGLVLAVGLAEIGFQAAVAGFSDRVFAIKWSTSASDFFLGRTGS